jgi:hypothetical protein
MPKSTVHLNGRERAPAPAASWSEADESVRFSVLRFRGCSQNSPCGHVTREEASMTFAAAVESGRRMIVRGDAVVGCVT